MAKSCVVAELIMMPIARAIYQQEPVEPAPSEPIVPDGEPLDPYPVTDPVPSPDPGPEPSPEPNPFPIPPEPVPQFPPDVNF